MPFNREVTDLSLSLSLSVCVCVCVCGGGGGGGGGGRSRVESCANMHGEGAPFYVDTGDNIAHTKSWSVIVRLMVYRWVNLLSSLNKALWSNQLLCFPSAAVEHIGMSINNLQVS